MFILFKQGDPMKTYIAVIVIMIKDRKTAHQLNEILHEYADYSIGRMGLPYPKKKVNIISLAIDAPQSIISTLSEKINTLPGVNVNIALDQF